MLAAMFDTIGGITPEKDCQKQDPLVEQIKRVREQLFLVEELFNRSEDEDLIEACIYQTKAFNSYYRYLLRLAREENCTTRPKLEPTRALRVAGLL